MKAIQLKAKVCLILTLLHSERPKLYTILAFLSAIGLKQFHLFLKPLTDLLEMQTL